VAEVAVRIDPGQDGGYGVGTWLEAEGRWIDYPNVTWDGPVQYFGKFVDVSDRAFSVNIRRGRQDETEPYGAGSSTVAVRNLDGFFDPSGPFPLRVRQPVQIRSSAQAYGAGTWAEAEGRWVDVGPAVTWLGPSLFVGFIEDTDLRYEPSGYSQLDIRCVDGLSILSNQVIADTAVPLELSGDRVRRILEAVGVDFPGPTEVDDGFSLLAAGTAVGNATQYLRQVEVSEQGRLFVDRTGILTFLDRRAAAGTPYIFSDDGTGTAYSSVDRFSGARSLFNRIVAQREGGATFAFNDERSQAEFSTRTLDLGTLLAATDTLVVGIIEALAVLFRRPFTRVFAATIPVDRLSPADEYDIVELDLFSAADVTFTPPGSGPIVLQALIQGIEHNITVGAAWTTQIYFERRFDDDVFTLDDATLGRLNISRLGF